MHGQHSLQRLLGQIGKWHELEMARAGDERVDAPEPIDGSGDCGGDLVSVGNVGGGEECR